jgi:hypothetical protein
MKKILKRENFKNKEYEKELEPLVVLYTKVMSLISIKNHYIKI